ncbi:hypothetical protein SAMN02744783_04904, partial [Serratia sp. CC22-02]
NWLFHGDCPRVNPVAGELDGGSRLWLNIARMRGGLSGENIPIGIAAVAGRCWRDSSRLAVGGWRVGWRRVHRTGCHQTASLGRQVTPWVYFTGYIRLDLVTYRAANFVLDAIEDPTEITKCRYCYGRADTTQALLQATGYLVFTLRPGLGSFTISFIARLRTHLRGRYRPAVGGVRR